MALEPFRIAGESNYKVSFRDPSNKTRVISRSLKTSDEMDARSICLDILKIVRDRALWDIANPRLGILDPRAVVVFHGQPHVPTSAVLTVNIELVENLNFIGKLPGITASLPNVDADKLNARVAELEQTLRDTALRNEVLEARVRDQDRKQNLHCRITLHDAIEQFFESYTHRKHVTITQARLALRRFEATMGSKVRIGDIKTTQIDKWLGSLPVGVASKRRHKIYVHMFFKWAKKRWELNINPVDDTDPIAGVTRRPENIEAIRHPDQIAMLLAALRPDDYWYALVATGLFLGPRYSELAHIKMSDVFLADGYLRIASRAHEEVDGGALQGTKTGRERTIPIELTVLLPILREYLQWRALQSWQSYRFLFPSIVDVGFTPRTKTPPGLWSHGSTFLRALRVALGEARARADVSSQSLPIWDYTPWEWRHTAGTAMGRCGMSSLEISLILGNREDVCRRHYIGVLAEDASSSRWTYRWR